MTDARRQAAERQRRKRERERAGVIVLTIPVDDVAVAEALIETHRLNAAFYEHRAALTAAAAKVLSDWAESVTRDGTDPLPMVKMHLTEKENH